MGHQKSIHIVEEMVECAIKISHVVCELRESLSTCQVLLWIRCAPWQVVELIGTF